ncbi:MAG: hypothetical protein MZU95_09970 [Desulfomicrobium escambiense]|nr:hypothetical protein [Desulfomicrobium escambiense]
MTLNKKRIAEMALGLQEVAQLPDPVGEITKMWQNRAGQWSGRMRVPIGVIGIICRRGRTSPPMRRASA